MTRLLIAFAVLLCLVHSATAATYEETFTPKANKAYNEDINVWVYSSEFAKRFGMPQAWVDEDLKGAHAVAFRVETSPARLMFPHKGPDVSMPQRDCILDLYVPSATQIPWLDGQTADFKFYTPDSPAYLAPQTPEDREWRRRAVGVVHAGPKAKRPLMRLNGGTLFLREYDKKLYPGIVYISFSMGCMTPPKSKSKVEFCEDRRWSGQQCHAHHEVDIPNSLMKRLYKHWNQNSRSSAVGEWTRVIKGNGSSPDRVGRLA